MSQSKKTRPLGSVKYTNVLNEKVPKFPQINTAYQGISGNAMSVPPTKVTPEKQHKSPRRTTTTARSTSSKSDSSGRSDEAAVKKTDEKVSKELKESQSREKSLKQKIVDLQKIIDELRAQLAEKEKLISDLQAQLNRKEAEYIDELEKEKARHLVTKEELKTAQGQLDQEKKASEELRRKHEKEMKELNDRMEKRLIELRTDKDKEIAVRDEKLGNLKRQIADALKGNSWERQQQLDELTKELTRISDEADLLRMKLKSYKKNGSAGACANCPSLEQQVEQSNKTLRDKDKTIKELKTLCAKFEKQLTQQDALLKQWAESKGHKL